MKLRNSLSLKISLLAFFNLLLVAIVIGLFVRLQFRVDLSSVLLAPARDRILSLSRLVALQLPETNSSKWTESLAQYAAPYGVQLYLFANNDRQVAGPKIQFPAEMVNWVERDARFHRREHEHEDAPPPNGHPPLFFIRTPQTRGVLGRYSHPAVERKPHQTSSLHTDLALCLVLDEPFLFRLPPVARRSAGDLRGDRSVLVSAHPRVNAHHRPDDPRNRTNR